MAARPGFQLDRLKEYRIGPWNKKKAATPASGGFFVPRCVWQSDQNDFVMLKKSVLPK